MNTPEVQPSPEPIPADDATRHAVNVRADGPDVTHLSVVGDTYTILVAGSDTAGQYTMIDMHIPPDGGPPPHRHDFEEAFVVLEGQIDVTFREDTFTAHAGDTINVPANAPHRFTNSSAQPARLLCFCSPAGQDEFFGVIGQPVAERTSPPPPADPAVIESKQQQAAGLAAQYRTEILKP